MNSKKTILFTVLSFLILSNWAEAAQKQVNCGPRSGSVGPITAVMGMLQLSRQSSGVNVAQGNLKLTTSTNGIQTVAAQGQYDLINGVEYAHLAVLSESGNVIYNLILYFSDTPQKQNSYVEYGGQFSLLDCSKK